MIIHAEFQQKNGGDPTSEWQKIRTGCITASEFKNFVGVDGKLRTGEMPKSYMAEKLFERWTGRQKPNDFFDMAMNNGVIIEEKAAAFAALEYGLEIQHVGFVSNEDGTVGASPDGLIGFPGLKLDAPTLYGVPKDSASGIEIKCPNHITHIKYQMDNKLPSEPNGGYVSQVQGSMFCTGCRTWNFLSYPLTCYLDGFPPFHMIIERDEEWQKNFADSLDEFMQKFNSEFEKMVDRNGGLPLHRQQPELQPTAPAPISDDLGATL